MKEFDLEGHEETLKALAEMKEQIQGLTEQLKAVEEELQKLKAEKEKSPCTPLKGKEESNPLTVRAEKKFKIPSAWEVQEYLDSIFERRFTGQKFVDYYDCVGWMVGKGKPMRKWKSAVRMWIKNENKEEKQQRKATRYETSADREQRIREEHDREVYELIRRKLARNREEQEAYGTDNQFLPF